MSQVVPAFVGTVRTGILEGLACGTSRNVRSSPLLLGLSGLGF